MPSDPHSLRTQSVGRIAAELPGATGVFRSFGMEFCCQGHVSLADAARHGSLDLGEVETALHALDPSAEPDAPQETAALISYIQTRYHDAHRRQIAELLDLSAKVESVHVNHPQVPAGLSQILQQFQTELGALMQKQEKVQFPALQEKTPDKLALSIRTMRHDHNEYAFFLDQIDRATDARVPPGDACQSWCALYAGVEQFKTDLMEHIHLENNVLFPRFEAAREA